MNKRALGKGLGAIIATTQTSKAPAEETERAIIADRADRADAVLELDLSKIEPNPDQPRLHFDDHEIENLAESIRAVGLIQPIIVRRENDTYFIVAGERRFRAIKLLGMRTIKAILIQATEEQNISLALIENIQRQNLDPIEEAKAYRLLISRFRLKQQDVAQRVGKERATIANSLRLLSLPEVVQQSLTSGELSQGHAKVLLSVEDEDKQMRLFRQCVDNGLSVRALESLIKESDPLAQLSQGKQKKKDAHIKTMEEKLVAFFGTKVEIRHSTTGKGKIEISYYSVEDFERLMEKFE